MCSCDGSSYGATDGHALPRLNIISMRFQRRLVFELVDLVNLPHPLLGGDGPINWGVDYNKMEEGGFPPLMSWLISRHLLFSDWDLHHRLYSSLALQNQMAHHGASKPSYLCWSIPHNQSILASLSEYAYTIPLVKGRIAMEILIFHPLPHKAYRKWWCVWRILIWTRQDWRPQSEFFLPKQPTSPPLACSSWWPECRGSIRPLWKWGAPLCASSYGAATVLIPLVWNNMISEWKIKMMTKATSWTSLSF